MERIVLMLKSFQLRRVRTSHHHQSRLLLVDVGLWMVLVDCAMRSDFGFGVVR